MVNKSESMKIIRSSKCFIDTEVSLNAEFMNNEPNTVIVLGGFEICKDKTIADLKKVYNKVIVFNQEQIRTKYRNFMSFEYYRFLKEADEVWDYDECNISALSPIRNDIKLHVLKPCNSLNAGTLNKEYDVLFYGWENDRRSHILNTLKQHGVNVCVPHHVYGADLNQYIAKSKICLNIHFYPDTALQEQARMIRWISSKANIISEPSRTNYFGVTEIPYDNLVKSIEDAL